MKLIKNYLYNVANQLITIIIPLVTIPYISRVLGPTGVGINAYTNSIISYFILFGSVGIGLYGNRTIACVRDNKLKMSKFFWEIVFLRIVMILIAYLCFLIFLYFYDEYHSFLLLQSILLVAVIFDISWFFMGIEDFKKTVLRNIFIKVISLIAIFTFVKNQNDIWVYILILVSSQFLGNLTLWGYLKKLVFFIPIHRLSIFSHLKSSIYFFIPQIAMQIYLVLNRTMLGSLSSIDAVAFYDNSDKIIKMLLAIITATGAVMLPRMANHFAKKEHAKIEESLQISFHFVCFLAFPLALGIMATSSNFCSLFFGSEFNGIDTVMFCLSPVVLFIGMSNVLGVQYLLPTGQLKAFTLSVTGGAIINFILNWYLIICHGAIGATISTVLSELMVVCVQFHFVRKRINIFKLLNGTWKYLLASILMFIIVYLIGYYYSNLLGLILQAIVGLIIYLILIWLLKPVIIQQMKLLIKKI